MDLLDTASFMRFKRFFSCVFLFFAVVPLLAAGEAIVPNRVNVTCKDIKTPDGFSYDIKPENQDSVVSVEMTQNGKTIYNGRFKDLNCSSKGCDNRTITTVNCSNISVKFIHYREGEKKISESRLDINVISEPEINAIDKSSTDPFNLSTIVACTVILVVVVIVFVLLARCTKKGRGFVVQFMVKFNNLCVNKQTETSTVHEQRSDEENRKNAGQEELLLEKGENGMCYGGTDVSINMEASTTDIKSDDEITPLVNGISQHKTLNGNMGHDPGGGKEDTTLHCNGDLSHHEKSTGEQRISGDKEDGCSSAFNQRSTREEPFDKTAGSEGRASVHGVGPGRASISPPDNVDIEAHHKAAAFMLNNNNNNNI